MAGESHAAVQKDGHFVYSSSVDGPQSGGETCWGAALQQVVRGLVVHKAVEVCIRVFERVFVKAVVGKVISAGATQG